MKQKHFLFKALFLLLLFSFFLSACGSGKETADVFGDNGDPNDFSGMSFTFLDGDDGSSYCPTYGDNLISDQMLDWMKTVQERYDVQLTTDIGTYDALVKAASAWTPYADLISFRNYRTYSAYKAGYILPLEEISTIDMFSGKYGSRSLLENLNWNGETVAFWPAYWGVDLPCFSDALLYNPRLIGEYQLGDPQELYEQGRWNWNTYEQMARQMADSGSEKGENPVYFSAYDTYTLRLALYSNGAEFFSPEEDGHLVVSLDSANGIQAIDWFMSLGKISSFMDWSGDSLTNEVFYEGNMVFFPEYSVTGLKLNNGTIGKNMQEEWRYCYYPIGPSGTAEDIKRGHFSNESRFVSVLQLTDEPDILGSFMEVLFSPTFETEDGWKESFLNTNFFDEFSQDYYMTKWENIRFDYSSFFKGEFDGLMSSLVGMTASKSERLSSLSAILESKGEQIQTLLDHAYDK